MKFKRWGGYLNLGEKSSWKSLTKKTQFLRAEFPGKKYEKLFSRASNKMHLHLTTPVAHRDLSQQKKKSVSKCLLTLMGSQQTLHCTGPQNSSRQRNSSPAVRLGQSQQEQGKEQQPRHCAGGRDQSSRPVKNRAGGIMKNYYRKMFHWLAAFCVCLFNGFALRNGNNGWKS